jgi:hypothetical protein
MYFYDYFLRDQVLTRAELLVTARQQFAGMQGATPKLVPVLT